MVPRVPSEVSGLVLLEPVDLSVLGFANSIVPLKT
jgi:hypothetical protein